MTTLFICRLVDKCASIVKKQDQQKANMEVEDVVRASDSDGCDDEDNDEDEPETPKVEDAEKSN